MAPGSQMLSGHIFSPSLWSNLQLVPLFNNTLPSSFLLSTGWFGGCSPLYHIFCSILHIIYFSNNYLLYIVSYNLIYILGRIPPHLDLYLVFQGHSFSLYYTVSCTGTLFHLVQLFQILILIHLVTGRL